MATLENVNGLNPNQVQASFDDETMRQARAAIERASLGDAPTTRDDLAMTRATAGEHPIYPELLDGWWCFFSSSSRAFADHTHTNLSTHRRRRLAHLA